MSEFKLTVEEANVLDKIAEATKMDCWFRIDENLHVQDIEEPDNPVFSDDAGGVRLLEDGLAYGLDKPQSGGLTPEEILIAEACFKRARAAKGSERSTGLTVKATVTFQRWEGDVARFNGEAEFDACDALDSFDDEMIALIEHGEPYALDEVYKTAVRLGQIHDYDGPFEVELDEDNLSDYLEARKEGK